MSSFPVKVILFLGTVLCIFASLQITAAVTFSTNNNHLDQVQNLNEKSFPPHLALAKEEVLPRYTKLHVPARDTSGKRISCWTVQKCCDDCKTLGFKNGRVFSCKKCQCD